MPGAFGPPWDLISLSPANPPVGNVYALTVAAGFWYHVIAARYTIATSATVTNRTAAVYYQDPSGNVNAVARSTPNQPASTTFTYELGLNFQASGLLTANLVQLYLPDLAVPETWLFVLDVTTRQAGDQISAITIFYERLAYV